MVIPFFYIVVYTSSNCACLVQLLYTTMSMLRGKTAAEPIVIINTEYNQYQI